MYPVVGFLAAWRPFLGRRINPIGDCSHTLLRVRLIRDETCPAVSASRPQPQATLLTPAAAGALSLRPGMAGCIAGRPRAGARGSIVAWRSSPGRDPTMCALSHAARAARVRATPISARSATSAASAERPGGRAIVVNPRRASAPGAGGYHRRASVGDTTSCTPPE